MNTIRRFWAIEDKGEDAKAGWYAWYVMSRSPYVISHPLIGWALVTRDNEDTIVGIVADLTKVIEADKPEDGTDFVMYMQRGGWSQDQIDQLKNSLIESGKRREANEQEARRNATAVGSGGVLQTTRKDGATTQHQRALRALQESEERTGQGSGSDAPLQPPIDVEE